MGEDREAGERVGGRILGSTLWAPRSTLCPHFVHTVSTAVSREAGGVEPHWPAAAPILRLGQVVATETINRINHDAYSGNND